MLRELDAYPAGTVGAEPNLGARASHTSEMLDVPLLDEPRAGKISNDVRDGGLGKPRLGCEFSPRTSAVVSKVPQYQPEVGSAHLRVSDGSLLTRVRNSKTVMFVHTSL